MKGGEGAHTSPELLKFGEQLQAGGQGTEGWGGQNSNGSLRGRWIIRDAIAKGLGPGRSCQAWNGDAYSTTTIFPLLQAAHPDKNPNC